MRKLFETLKTVLLQGQDAVLVTVVASSGSTPRGSGARMLVTRSGRLYGTIGGGAVEYQSEQVALDVLQTGRSHTEKFMLHKNQVRDLGMICGGSVVVYFHHIPGGSRDVIALCDRADALFAAGERSWIVTEISGDAPGSLSLYGAQSGLMGAPLPQAVLNQLAPRPTQIEADGHTYYAETLIRAGRVFIFGGGHVAQSLVPALSAVDFRCVVLEDREDFCRPDLFPGVEETRLIRMDAIEETVSIGKDDYICIMTRGHKDDTICEAFALRTPACYIGVIGSRRKTQGVNERLREMGFTDADIARVTTPIGLEIHAETPAEIAVSIAAQLIAVRASRMRG